MTAELLDLARRTAREAGALIQSLRAESVEVADTKSSATDVVTAADRASEELIRRLILQARPDDSFLGEEGDAIHGTSGVRWVVDPIDGTVNYLYGIPQYAVSIAAEVEGEIACGVVLNPASGEEFHALRGAGAWLGNRRLVMSDTPDWGQALVATGFGYEVEVRRAQGAAAAQLLPQVRDIRRAGACALDLAFLAAGRLDAYVEVGPHYWDHAAGSLLVNEAGGRFEARTTSTGRSLLIGAHRDRFGEFLALVVETGFGDV